MAYTKNIHEPSLNEKSKCDSWISKSSQESDSRPFLDPRAFSLQGSRLKSYSKYGTAYKGGTLRPNLPYTFGRLGTRNNDLYVNAHNKALAKVNDQLRVCNSFWEDWYERQQSVNLITSSVKALLRFAKNYKNPRYWRHLGKNASPADLPSAWLTYQFGIKPLVGGIDRAVNLLLNDFPHSNISGTSVHNESKVITSPHDRSWGPSIGFANYKARCKIGCRVVGVNPNRTLSGATGLGEGFSSAWSVIPWGWAVDYFLNVSELLSNLEDNHPGIIVTGWYVTNIVNVDLQSRTKWEDTDPEYAKRWSFESSTSHVDMTRTIPKSMPLFQPKFRFPKLGSNQAANLSSALALTMKGKK